MAPIQFRETKLVQTTAGIKFQAVPDEPLLNIIHEDERLLVLNKPAGLVCHPTKGDEYSSLVGRVRLYLKADYHLINRLDRETSGIVIIGKEDRAARLLRRAWEGRMVRKSYLAI